MNWARLIRTISFKQDAELDRTRVKFHFQLYERSAGCFRRPAENLRYTALTLDTSDRAIPRSRQFGGTPNWTRETRVPRAV